MQAFGKHCLKKSKKYVVETKRGFTDVRKKVSAAFFLFWNNCDWQSVQEQKTEQNKLGSVGKRNFKKNICRKENGKCRKEGKNKWCNWIG